MGPLVCNASLRQTPSDRLVVWLPGSSRVWKGSNWAPETRHTCSPNRGSGSPCGPGLVSGVSVREMAEEKIFMMSFLEANWPSSVGINGNCSVW